LQNASVIRAATIPNVMLNISQLQQDRTPPPARFFSGDWKDFAYLISTELSANKNKYDCILTSETIYNPDNHQKLLSVFKACLGAHGVMYPLKLYEYF
jgi:predicted nicotinamide N-methyase